MVSTVGEFRNRVHNTNCVNDMINKVCRYNKLKYQLLQCKAYACWAVTGRCPRTLCGTCMVTAGLVYAKLHVNVFVSN